MIDLYVSYDELLIVIGVGMEILIFTTSTKPDFYNHSKFL